jgi:hypothetical protein
VTALRIENFSGIAPRYSARLLSQNQAQAAQNTKLLSGEIRGYHEAQLLHDFNPLQLAYPVARAFRLPATVTAPIPLSGSDQWIGFKDAAVNFVRTPVLEDQFERYYWTGDSTNGLSGAPCYNTRARINAGNSGGNAPFILGIPTPTVAPTVAAPAGSAETRAYTYTFISAYGEEGSPAPATVVSGGAPGTWTITGIQTTVPNQSEYNLATTRIYRSVSGAYFWVADIAFGTSSYSDSIPSSTVALNFTLPSLNWTPPPTTLQGLVAHPGGFLVGFEGRDVWMSQPYEPHAWPLQNVQTCQTEVVGLAIFQNNIIVMTTSHPYFGSGMSPGNITLQKMDAVEPCVSQRSIATTVDGVYYASPQGIILNNGSQTQLVTRQLFTREEWQNYFSPTTIYAVPYGVEYVAFSTTSTGFIFSPMDPTTPLTQLDRFSNVLAIQQDQYSGDAYLVSNSQVLLWDPPNSIPYSYSWQSKVFDLPKPVNFGAMRLKFNAGVTTVSPSQLTAYTIYNGNRILKPLNPINGSMLNGVRTLEYPTFSTPGYAPPPEIRSPIAGSSLFPISQYENITGGATVIIQARDLMTTAWITVFQGALTTERIYRMPAGIKSDGWQVTIIGNTSVYSFAMAETAKELMNV